MDNDKFETWGVVELFEHSRIAGKISEATIGGCSFVRVDVPEVGGRPAFSKLYGNGAIYSMTPTSEEVVMAALKSIHEAPLNVYMPEVQLID